MFLDETRRDVGPTWSSEGLEGADLGAAQSMLAKRTCGVFDLEGVLMPLNVFDLV
jgi:hypothetical protein